MQRTVALVQVLIALTGEWMSAARGQNCPNDGVVYQIIAGLSEINCIVKPMLRGVVSLGRYDVPSVGVQMQGIAPLSCNLIVNIANFIIHGEIVLFYVCRFIWGAL